MITVRAAGKDGHRRTQSETVWPVDAIEPWTVVRTRRLHARNGPCQARVIVLMFRALARAE